MKEDIFRIGQEIKCVEDFEIESSVTSNKIRVRKGDTAYIDSHGAIHYTSGEARGKIEFSNFEMKGYDHENIARMIMSKLILVYDLESILDDYDISKDDVKDEIEDILSDIL